MILNIIIHLNYFYYLINFFEVILLIKNKIFYIFEIQNFHMKDFNYFQNIKKNENFELIIKNYILKDYFIFNNYNNINSTKFWLYHQQQWFFLNFEIFIIGFQKFMYEYIDFWKPLFNWYGNYKLLVYKNVTNTNLIEDLYHNISLDLLLDIQNENNKSLIWLIQNKEHFNNILIKKAILNNLNFEINPWNNLRYRNFYIPDESWFGYKYLKKYYFHLINKEFNILKNWYKNETCDKLYDNWQYWNIFQYDKEKIYSSTIYKDINNKNLNKNLWIKIFENFNKFLKKNPYKVFLNIYHLNNKYSRVNLLTYGLTYDVNIFTSRNYENNNIFHNSWKNISNKDQFYNEIINKSIKTWYSIYQRADISARDYSVIDYNLFSENIYLYNTFYNKYYESIELDNGFVPDIIKLRGGIKETLKKFIVPNYKKFIVPRIIEKINIINNWHNRFEYLIKNTVNSVNYLSTIYNMGYKLGTEMSKIFCKDIGLERDFFFKVYSRFKTELIFPAINETAKTINIIIPKLYETTNAINAVIPKVYEQYQKFENFFIDAKKLFFNKILFNDEKKYWKEKNFQIFEKNNLIKLPIHFITKNIENKIVFKQLYHINANLNQIFNPTIAPTIYMGDIIIRPFIFVNNKITATLDNLIINPVYNTTIEMANDTINKTKDIIHQIYDINNNINYKVQIINFVPNLITKIKNWEQLNKKAIIMDTYLGNYTNMWNIMNDSGECWNIKKERVIPTSGHERLVYYIPYNWIKVDIKKVMDSVNKYNYLWVWKNPANQSLSELRSYFYDPETTIVNRKIVLISELKKKAKIAEKKLLLQKAKENKFGMEDSGPESWFFSRLYRLKYLKLSQLFNENFAINKFRKIGLKKQFNDISYIRYASSLEGRHDKLSALMEEQRNKRLFGQLVVKKETALDRYMKSKDPLNITGYWKGTEFYMSQLLWVTDLITYYEDKQRPWSVTFETYKFHDFSYITKVKVLRQFYKIKEFTDLVDKELEYYPKDMIKRFYTLKNEKKIVHYIMNLEGYNQLLINKNIFKTALLSNDFYSITYDSPFSLKDKCYRKSLLMEDFRDYRTNIIYSIKNKKEDYLIFSKFKYNKPDIIENLNHRTSFSIWRKRTGDIDPFFSWKNYWNQWVSKYFRVDSTKIRRFPINNAIFWHQTKDNLYDIAHLQNNKVPISKIEQYEIDYFLSENNKILEKSNKLYKSSTNNTLSFLREEYLNFLYSNNKKMNTEIYLKKNAFITWDIFYTQIEDVTESLNLNILNKKIYGNSLYNKEFKLLPKNTNVLLKKKYIIQLLNVFQKEEQSIKNYILFKINKGFIKFLSDFKFINNYNFNKINNYLKWFFISLNKSFLFFIDFMKEVLLVKILEYKQIKIIVKYYKWLNINISKYINILVIIVCIFIYCLISSALIILIKSFLPKNIIYSIKIKQNKIKERNFEPINEASKFIEDLNSEDLNKLLYDVKKNNKKIINNINEINDINIENIQKLKLQKKLNNLQFKKNFFDAENRYIYTWEGRYDRVYYENSNLIKKGVQNLKKIKIYNKFEAKKKKI